MLKKKNIFSFRIVSIVAVFLLVFISFTPSFDKKAEATGSTGDLHGYAWSMGIGWISLNCAEGNVGTTTMTSICSTSNYKVSVNTSGAMTGYAWSPSIGWIGFDSANTSACGSLSANLDTTSGIMSGWARALTGGTAGSGGWDGCIKLHSTSSDTYAFGVTYNPASTATSTFGPGIPFNSGGTNYAWGDMNLGWIDFSHATFNATATTVDIKIDIFDGAGAVDGPVTMTSSGGPANLTWTSTGATSCTASANSSLTGSFASGWSGSKPLVSPSPFGITVPANTTSSTIDYQYIITCSGISDLVIVHVPPPTIAACSISPASTTLTPTSSSVSYDPGFTASWTGTGGTFPLTSLSVDTGGSSSISASVDSGGTVSAPGSFTVSITGTATSSTQTVTVNGSGTYSGSTVTCAPATITIGPFGTGTGTGTTGTHRPPWIEF